MTATYVLSGGSDTSFRALGARLRAVRLLRLAEPNAGRAVDLRTEAPCDLRAEAVDITCWIHMIPDASSTSQRPTASAVASVLAVGELADELLPDGAGASLTFVLPAWGVIATEKQAAAELAASAARALMQCNLENWAARNRRINIIRVGAADDALFTSTRKLDDLVARTPMHRAATSDEIADAIDFLASEAAGYVTGSVLDVDGGWSAYSWFFPARDL